ncbi:MAG TPA: lipase maturation factor family protein [Gemmatimonadaceae bacterium]|nr:lipase maturation factor family protein [Gemmatimonadaceae bacterium]
MASDLPRSVLRHLAAPAPEMVWPRWIFLRALGLIFGSAFYSLVSQIHGLIGPNGILPATLYLDSMREAAPGIVHVWAAPTLLWFGTSDLALNVLVWSGLIASMLLTINIWPRVTAAACTIAFLSCIAALQDFSSYQSDGMLMQAGVAAVLLAPPGIRPGLAANAPPPRAAVWLLRWEWFSIYFESGLVKILSGDVQWRTLTAMDHYYENNPLPTWLGWYEQQLPHVIQAGVTLMTLAVELLAPWVVFAPRLVRRHAAVFLTLFQIGIITTANYCFLNYLVLALGVFLVDVPSEGPATTRRVGWVSVGALFVTLYASTVDFFARSVPEPFALPARLLAPFRVANAYGLFAVMTTAEYEIEFQGSRDDTTWVAYPFRYKPQDPKAPPGLYAPYQPRFEWNLWFASLGPWNESPWVVTTQARLLLAEPSVLELFARNPFASAPPTAVRSVIWRYWFTDFATRRRTQQWWNRELLGVYAGVVRRGVDGALHFTPAPEHP